MKTKNRSVLGLLLAGILAAVSLSAQAQTPVVRLPFSTVPASVAPLSLLTSASFYVVTVTNIPAGYDVTNGRYAGWCVMPTVAITNRILYPGTLCSSYVTSSLSTDSYPIPSDLATADWPRINYVINSKTNFFAQGALYTDVQYAIWYLLAGNYNLFTPAAGVIVTNALLNGGGYTPPVGGKMAVIVDFDRPLTEVPLAQDLIIEVTVPAVSQQAPPSGTISGNVYADLDDNGVLDAGDTGLNGVKIVLSGVNYLGQSVAFTNFTATDGSYSFIVPPGTYSVSEGATPGYLQNTNTVGSLGGSISGDVISGIVVAASAAGTGYNFGELPAASISGFNYIDSDNNGIFSGGESPIFGTTITLTGTNDQSISVTLVTTTGVLGDYSFTGLRPGLYSVTETQNPGLNLLQGKNTVGQTNTIADGLLGPSVDQLSQIILRPGSVGTNYNFGELPPGSLSGFTYIDLNNNGLFENGETPLAGIAIVLSGNDYTGHPVLLSTTTTNDGSYIFTNLPPSDLNGYSITETAPVSPLLVLGKNTPGSLGGTTGPTLIDAISMPPGGIGAPYNFGELPLPVTSNPADQTVCSGSPAALSVIATGYGSLTYQWRKSGNNLIDSGDVSGTSSSTLSFSSADLTDAGSYDVVVSNAYGAVISKPAGLTVNPTPILSLSKTDVQCHGAANGTVTAAVGGSFGTISIDGGPAVAAVASQTFSGLSAGVHTIKTVSPAGCWAMASIEILEPATTVTISSVSKTDVTCNGSASGGLTINASGGTGSLSYSIDNGATFQTNNVFTNLTASRYSVVVSDLNSCMVTTNVTITEPASVLAINSVLPTDASCKGTASGGLTINATGGTAPLSYSINGGLSYVAGNVFAGLSAGNYSVVVKDKNGCFSSQMASVGEPVSLLTISSVSKTDVRCKGDNSGSISILAGGGTGDVAYSIDGGLSYNSSAQINNLVAGNYHIVVKDRNGCIADGGTVTIAQPADTLSIVSLTASNVTCKGSATGLLTISAMGGTPDYSYSIDSGVTFQTNNVFTNLVASNYSVFITDANGCTISTNATITEPATALVISAVTTKDVSCKGTATGSIAVTASGGTGTLRYSINNGATWTTNPIFSNLLPSVYTITVKDDGGCVITDAAPIGEPLSALTVSVIKTDITCAGAANGTFTASVSGGVGPYYLTINNGTNSIDANSLYGGLAPGDYLISATDNNNCIASVPFTITQPAPLLLSLNPTDASCNLNSGVVAALFSGGTAPYTLTINGTNSSTANTLSRSFSGLGAGTYGVALVDGNGCSITQYVQIKGTCPLLLTCPINTGKVGVVYTSSLVASGGVSPYTFAITAGGLPAGLDLNTNTGAITGSPTSAGTFGFTATVTDAQGTVTTASCSSGCVSSGTWDFSTPLGALGTSQKYTNSGLVITAYGYTNINTPLALYSKNAGATEMGLGLAGTTDHEIGTNEFVQLDLGQLIASNAQNPTLVINSVQSPEKYNIYGSSSQGTLGTLILTNSTLGNTPFAIPRYPAYRFISIRSVYDDVLITSLSASLPVSGCYITVAPGSVPLILTGPTNTGRGCVCYSSALKVNGGTAPYSFAITSGSLPPGLVLNCANGSITGTPTTVGVFTFTAQVTDASGTKATGTFTITIGTCPLTVGCVSYSCGIVGSSFSGSIPVSGGTPTYSYSIPSSTLPPGLVLNPTSGLISGTPTTAGTFPITITVTDKSGQTAVASCSIKIAPQPLSLNCIGNSSAQVGSSYSSAFSASGGTSPYSYSIRCGCLPAGLTLNPLTGAVTGTPTAAGTYSFTAQVIDSTSGTRLVATTVCCIRVAPKALTIGCLSTTSANVGACFSSAFVTSGGIPSLTFSIISGCLPPGLSLNSCSGLISGTPSTAGVYPFTVQVKDRTSPTCLTATVSCSIAVTAIPTGLQANPDCTGVKLTWCAIKASGTVTYTVSRSTASGGPYTVLKAGLTSTSYTDATATPGVTYYYVVSATVGGIASPNSAQVSATISNLPSAWYTTDVGCVGSAGCASYNNGCFTLTGSGADIWGTADAFRCAYQYSSGDCSIICKVSSVQNTSPWAKAGLTIRESTASCSEHVSIFVTPGNGVAFQWRSSTGSGSYNVNLTGIQASCWLKLIRTGNYFSAYYSTDPACSSSSWKQVGGTQCISMASSATIGLGVTSHCDGVGCTAVFSSITSKP